MSAAETVRIEHRRHGITPLVWNDDSKANQKVETHPYFYSIDGVNPWKAKPNSHDGRRKDRTLLQYDSELNKI
jgi:hypothetical protein